ncbi:MAG: hypothetical protein KDK70_42800, partial [Myxococcales bacterium]|nr:hypothetical protein [Myxococcales bacterium]
APAPASADRQAAAHQALARHLGYTPDVHLTAPARHGDRDGLLVVLRELTAFVREEPGRWVVGPIVDHDAMTHVEVDASAVLHTSMGPFHERFGLGAAEAQAVLAMLRAFAG